MPGHSSMENSAIVDHFGQVFVNALQYLTFYKENKVKFSKLYPSYKTIRYCSGHSTIRFALV